MGSFKNLLSIQHRLIEKSEEIESIKQRRRELFIDFATNENLIVSLYYEIEFKKLELMYIKREQITELRNSTDVYDRTTYLQQLSRLQNINEKCITLLLKRLFEEGYGLELKQRGLVTEHKKAAKSAEQTKVI